MFRYFKIRKQLKYYDKILKFIRRKPVGYKTSYKDLYEHLTGQIYPKNINKHTENVSWVTFKKSWFSKTLSTPYDSYKENEKLKDALNYIESQGYIAQKGQNILIKNQGLNKSFWSDYKSNRKFWTKIRVRILALIAILIFLGFTAKDIYNFIVRCFSYITSFLN